MPVGTEIRGIEYGPAERPERPAVVCCESKPGTSVLLESGNTDGWLASDTTVAVTR